MPEPKTNDQELLAKIETLPERQALALKLRFGIGGYSSASPSVAAEAMGITVDEYRRVEHAAILGLRGGSRV